MTIFDELVDEIRSLVDFGVNIVKKIRVTQYGDDKQSRMIDYYPTSNIKKPSYSKIKFIGIKLLLIFVPLQKESHSMQR